MMAHEDVIMQLSVLVAAKSSVWTGDRIVYSGLYLSDNDLGDGAGDQS